MASRPGPASLSKGIGARIRALRMAAGITQESLAWDCDLDKGYMSQVESGKRLPSLPVLFAVAARLGIEAADIVGFKLTNQRLQLLDATRRSDREGVQKAIRRLKLD